MRCVPGYNDRVSYHAHARQVSFPQFSGEIDTPFAIIGLGAAGLATIRGLLDEGIDPADIIGIEAGLVGRSAAAARNGGQILFTFGEHSPSEVFDHFGASFAENWLQRAEHVVDRIRQLPGWQGGAATLAITDRQCNALRQWSDDLNQIGHNHVFHDGNIDMPCVMAMVIDPHAGRIDPARLIEHEAAAIASRGVRLFEKSPVSLIEPAPQGTTFYVGSGTVKCSHAMIAAGAGLLNINGIGQIGASFSDDQKKPVHHYIQDTGTMILVTEPLPEKLATPLQRFACANSLTETCDYFHLDDQQRLNFGSFNFFDGTATPSLDFLVERIRPYSPDIYAMIRGRKIGISHFWSGYDSITPTVEPVVRQHIDPEGGSITLLSGGNGAGNTSMRVLGWWAAENLVHMLNGHKPDPDFNQLTSSPIPHFPGRGMCRSLLAAYSWTQQVAEGTVIAKAADYVRHNCLGL